MVDCNSFFFLYPTSALVHISLFSSSKIVFFEIGDLEELDEMDKVRLQNLA